MNDSAETYLVASTFPVQVPGASFLRRALGAAEGPISRLFPSGGLLRNGAPASAPCLLEAALIFMVDDTEGITELYQDFLKWTGYVVRAFGGRAEALAALTRDEKKPDLLIMDYFGDSMPADRFIQRCRIVHPALRILMASGLSQDGVRFSQARPDRFIQKPFTAEEFLQEVGAALTDADFSSRPAVSSAKGRPLREHQSNNSVNL